MAFRVINPIGPFGVPIVMASPITFDAGDFGKAFKKAVEISNLRGVQDLIIQDQINNIYRRAYIDYETRKEGTRAKIRHSSIPYSMVAPFLVAAPPLVPFAQVVSEKKPEEEKEGETSTGAKEEKKPEDDGKAKIIVGGPFGIGYVPGKNEARQSPGAFVVGPDKQLIPVNGVGIAGIRASVPGAVGVVGPSVVPYGVPYPGPGRLIGVGRGW